MIMIYAILLLLGLIEQTLTIQCFTCGESPYHCLLPLNLDAGDESNENDVEAYNYDPGYACMSDHSMDPRTGLEKLILRGINFCQEINIPNHRIHCCYTNHCNKQAPPMTVRTLADTMGDTVEVASNGYMELPSILWICFAMMLQYFY